MPNVIRSVDDIHAIEAESRAWVSSLRRKRKRLGRFAVADELLVAAEVAFQIGDRSVTNGFLMESSDYYFKWSKRRSDATTSDMEVLAELVFLGGTLPEGIHEEIDMSGYVERQKFLSLVYENKPKYHDYFAVGIVDIPTIRRFTAAGIDAELASKTVR